jgi:pleiotropic regulator 1
MHRGSCQRDAAREQVRWHTRFTTFLLEERRRSRPSDVSSIHQAGPDTREPDWRTPLLAALRRPGQVECHELGSAFRVVRAEQRWAVPQQPVHGARNWTAYRKVLLDGGPAVALDVSADNQLFAAGVWDRSIALFDLATGQTVHRFRSASQLLGPARALLFPETMPHLLFSGATDKRLLAWDIRTGRIALRLVGHRASVDAVAAHPRLSFAVVSGSADETIRVWDTRASGNLCIHELHGHQGGIRALVCRSTEPQLLSASEDCTVRVWDLAQGTAKSVSTRHAQAVIGLSTRWVEAVGAADEIEQLVSLSADGARIWNMPEMKLVEEITGASATLSAVAVSEDGQMVTADLEGQLHWWDNSRHCWQTSMLASSETDARPSSLSIGGFPIVLSAVFDRSATRLITGCSDDSIRMWRIHL